jgi:hypothetical protein
MVFLIVANFALNYIFWMDEALSDGTFLHKKTGYPKEYPVIWRDRLITSMRLQT